MGFDIVQVRRGREVWSSARPSASLRHVTPNPEILFLAGHFVDADPAEIEDRCETAVVEMLPSK